MINWYFAPIDPPYWFKPSTQQWYACWMNTKGLAKYAFTGVSWNTLNVTCIDPYPTVKRILKITGAAND